MNCYLIHLNSDGETSVYGVSSSLELKVIQNNGEEYTKYNEYDSFWKWFKDKIEYENEELCFIVSSNDEDFIVDKSINISSNHLLDEAKIKTILIKNQKIAKYFSSYPNTELSFEKESEKISEVYDEDNRSIQNYYIKQTLANKYRR